MTPQEKLQLDLSARAAFNAHDSEAHVLHYAPDCKFRQIPSAAAMMGESFVGHDGLRSMCQLYFEGAPDLTAEILEARIASDGMLLLKERLSGTSAVMAVSTSLDLWQAVEFRDGLMLTVTGFEQPPPGWDAAEPLALPGPEE